MKTAHGCGTVDFARRPGSLLLMRVTTSALRMIVGALAGLLLGGIGTGRVVAAGTDHSSAKWERFIKESVESYFKTHPEEGAYAGRHEFDGQLTDWSAEGLKRELAQLKSLRQDALAFSAKDLSEAQRFERDYFVSVMAGKIFWREAVDAPHRSPFYYADSLDPDVYVSRPYASLSVRLQAYTRYARSLPTALNQIKENLSGPLAPPLVAIGRVAIGGMAEFFEKEVPAIFRAVTDKALQAQFAEANTAAIAAVRDFDAWLAEKEKTATGSFALGPEKFQAMLKETEGVDISLAELEKIGEKDLERNLEALKTACAEFAPGKSIPEALALANAHKPEGTIVDYATKQLADLQEFVGSHDLVSIPGTEKALVAEAPAYKRWNFAYINIPGPYEKGLASVYYVAPADPSWPKQKQDDYVPGTGSLLFTSVHEVWPGHFLQFLHANRAPSLVGRVFVGYAFAEGWAHYTEEMMWEAGLNNSSPEFHIGQLQEALLRNVRFISAIGLHTKGMTVEESIKLFREKGYTDEATAEQQARRGTFDPAYLNYTMGKLMIRKLREDWTAAHGGRKAWKAFHDQFLQYGGPPIPLVRRAMLGEKDKGNLF